MAKPNVGRVSFIFTCKIYEFWSLQTFVCLTLGATLFALWDIADVIREAEK
ncbi:hypothetical protein phiAT3gORF43 [Lactobacillus phage phiAT3]|uniref:Uncharacterized protein n=1 Tax=Lactobacillus phage phiAT3 TaxID=279281 RepID=Q6J1U3_9CAUD|nr:hypothetical protein phiAT3gORF43 [Lactobacillus phage phiAT3]AAT36530.1 unknown [Lactobacillus phage phiAT3]